MIFNFSLNKKMLLLTLRYHNNDQDMIPAIIELKIEPNTNCFNKREASNIHDSLTQNTRISQIPPLTGKVIFYLCF